MLLEYLETLQSKVFLLETPLGLHLYYSELTYRGIYLRSGDFLCPLCSEATESSSYSFVSCEVAFFVSYRIF